MLTTQAIRGLEDDIRAIHAAALQALVDATRIAKRRATLMRRLRAENLDRWRALQAELTPAEPNQPRDAGGTNV